MRYKIAEDIEPWGERRADYRAALIIWTLACANSTHPPPFKKIMQMFDFRDNKEQTDEELDVIFKQIAAGSK